MRQKTFTTRAILGGHIDYRMSRFPNVPPLMRHAGRHDRRSLVPSSDVGSGGRIGRRKYHAPKTPFASRNMPISSKAKVGTGLPTHCVQCFPKSLQEIFSVLYSHREANCSVLNANRQPLFSRNRSV